MTHETDGVEDRLRGLLSSVLAEAVAESKEGTGVPESRFAWGAWVRTLGGRPNRFSPEDSRPRFL